MFFQHLVQMETAFNVVAVLKEEITNKRRSPLVLFKNISFCHFEDAWKRWDDVSVPGLELGTPFVALFRQWQKDLIKSFIFFTLYIICTVISLQANKGIYMHNYGT